MRTESRGRTAPGVNHTASLQRIMRRIAPLGGAAQCGAGCELDERRRVLRPRKNDFREARATASDYNATLAQPNNSAERVTQALFKPDTTHAERAAVRSLEPGCASQ